MFGDMMGKLQDMKQKTDEIKKKLDGMSVSATSADGLIRVVMNGNRTVKDILIDDSLLEDKEELQDMLIIAHNRALEKAEAINEEEMKGAASGILPGFPGL